MGKKKKRKLRMWAKVTLYSLFSLLVISSIENIEISKVSAKELSDSKIVEIKGKYNTCNLNENLKTPIFPNKTVKNEAKNNYGLQIIPLKISSSDSIKEDTKNIIVNVQKNDTPDLKLKDNEIIINNGDTFNEASLITYSNDESTNMLPNLKIESDVDTSKDGLYTVSITATNLQGNSVTEEKTVEVKTHEEVYIKEAKPVKELINNTNIDEIKYTDENIVNNIESSYEKLSSEAKKYVSIEEVEKINTIKQVLQERIDEHEEEERIKREKEEEEKKKREEAQTLAQLQAKTSTSISTAPATGGGSNPYAGGWANCTWGAWQLAHDNVGINLPAWGNAGNWLYSAQASGYATGQTPKANSIMVSSHHVAYVSSVSADGNSIYIKEGGWYGIMYNERWSPAYNASSGQDIYGYIYLD